MALEELSVPNSSLLMLLKLKLTALLQVDKIDLDLLISECNYSQNFIRTANDLQILDAISECYEEYKILSRKKSK